MNRIIISTDQFIEEFIELGIEDEILRKLENELLEKPDKGQLMPGVGGVRKVRLGTGYRGKSSSYRVLYIDFPDIEKIYLLMIYTKKELDNISNRQKSLLKFSAKVLKKENSVYR